MCDCFVDADEFIFLEYCDEFVFFWFVIGGDVFFEKWFALVEVFYASRFYL